LLKLLVRECDKEITCQDDCKKLQSDLDAAARWEADWLMAFHPDKCTVLAITYARDFSSGFDICKFLFKYPRDLFPFEVILSMWVFHGENKLIFNAAARWEADWLMAFHPDKCTVLSITQYM
jgi:hypothetical protein